ncbi:hypothetical protein ACOL3H_07035 [Aliarcobacter butzleri]
MEYLKTLSFAIAIFILIRIIKKYVVHIPIWGIISFLFAVIISFYLYVDNKESAYSLLIKLKEMNNEDGELLLFFMWNILIIPIFLTIYSLKYIDCIFTIKSKRMQ